jgi:hypothetical protein
MGRENLIHLVSSSNLPISLCSLQKSNCPDVDLHISSLLFVQRVLLPQVQSDDFVTDYSVLCVGFCYLGPAHGTLSGRPDERSGEPHHRFQTLPGVVGGLKKSVLAL